MSYPTSVTTVEMPTVRRRDVRRSVPTPGDESEARRMARHPISRWYLGWLVVRLSVLLAPTAVRPWHVTLAGAGLSALAVATLLVWPTAHPWAAVLVWGAWLCDRLDGALARRQRSATARGAWLDANLDEAADIALHIAVAATAAALWPAYAAWIWTLLTMFVAAKYLLMHGLWTEAEHDLSTDTPQLPAATVSPTPSGVMRRLYHLPGSADVRVHVLIVALATGWLAGELILVAGYYALRVVARYPLVMSRLHGGAV